MKRTLNFITGMGVAVMLLFCSFASGSNNPQWPDKTTLAPNYEFNMEVAFLVEIDGQTLLNGEVAAFVDGQLRGIEKSTITFPVTGETLYKVMIYSNFMSGEKVTFQVYDKTNDKLFSVKDTIDFVANTIADLRNPVVMQTFCPTISEVTERLPDNNAFVDFPFQLTWAASANALYYDLYLWAKGQTKPTTPTKAGMTNLVYDVSAGSLEYGKDYQWTVVAHNKCSQIESSVFVFSTQQLPDLHVTGIEIPTQIYAGHEITVKYTIRNDGNGPTGDGEWDEYVWLNSDPEIRIGNVPRPDLLSQIKNQKALGIGEEYIQEVKVTIPQGLIGSYFITVTADMNDALFIDWLPTGSNISPIPYTPSLSGSPYPYLTGWAHGGVDGLPEYGEAGNRSDNFFYINFNIETPPLPDLLVTQLVHPTTLFSGKDVSITYTMKNQGDVPVNESWGDDIYISPKKEFDGNAVNIGHVNNTSPIPVDGSIDIQTNVKLPDYIYGKYFLIIKANDAQDVYEGVYSQNNTYVTDTIDVTLSPPPDLVAKELTFPDDTFNNADRITINWTVANEGLAETEQKSWNDDVYISPVDYFDAQNSIKLLSKRQYRNLLSGDSYQESASVDIPAGITGSWYPFVFTDAKDEIFEFTATTNNFYFMPATIEIVQPDLAVDHVQVPAIATTNQKITLQWDLLNKGKGKLKSGVKVTDGIFLSQDMDLNISSDILLKTVEWSEELSAGTNSPKELELELPGNLLGNYYLMVYTDMTNTVYEGADTASNIGVSATQINILNPDLTASVQRPAEFTFVGQQLTVNWTVTNIGEGNVVNKDIMDVIAVSHRDYYDPNSFFRLDTVSYTLSLYPKRSIAKSTTVTIPCLTVDSLFVYVITDAGNSLYESDETNNRVHSSTDMDLLKPEIALSGFSMPASVSCGDTLKLNYNLKNEGTSSIDNVAITDQLYISVNPHLDLLNSKLLASFTYSVYLDAGETLDNSFEYILPYEYEGDYYLHIVSNVTETVCENNRDNNTVSAPVNIVFPPLPDLYPSIDVLAASVTAGEPQSLTYTVKNLGTKLTNEGRIDKVILSKTTDPANAGAIEIAAEMMKDSLAPGAQTQHVVDFRIPENISAGDYYILIVLDSDSTIVESNESNNTGNQGVQVKAYPVDIRAYELTAPTSGKTGQPITINFTVDNPGANATPAGTWDDALYISPIAGPHADQKLLSKQTHYGGLKPGDSYSVTVKPTLPYDLIGDFYIYLVVDVDGINKDIQLANNFLVNGGVTPLLTTIEKGQAPDFDIVTTSIPNKIVAGQPFKILYTTKNVGDADADQLKWNDKFFITGSKELDATSVELANVRRFTSIPIGAQHLDSVECVVPVSYSGYFNIAIHVDANNAVYEGDDVGKNKVFKDVLIDRPLPGDLIPVNIIPAADVVSGDKLDVNWEIMNQSENAISGKGLKDIVYLSVDTIWDINDKILGSVTSDVFISPYGSANRNISVKVSGLPDGEYFVIIKTDVLDRYNEQNETNNTGVSIGTVRITVPEIYLGDTEAGVLVNQDELNYKIRITSNLRNETMLTTLKADSLYGSNQMYMSLNEMPDMIKHQYAHLFAYQGNQELWVPSVREGSYYLMLTGQTGNGISQDFLLTPEILPFGIKSVDANYGGNTGKVTVELRGSKFAPAMRIWLAGGEDTVVADTIIFVDFATVYVTFDLEGVKTGMYDLNVLNYCDGVQTLPDAFEVRSGVAGELGYDLLLPTNPRPNRVVKAILEFENLGNTDIQQAFIEIRSLAGSPIGLTVDDLAKMQTQLIIPLVIADDYEGVLRPGIRGTIDVYIKITNGLVFSIKEYKINN